MGSTHGVAVDQSNVEQLRAWDGDEGDYWAAQADAYDRAVAEHHARLLRAAAIGRGERVLDIGCGTGQTTRDAARAAIGGFALGVDLSAAMLTVARRRAEAEGVPNVRFDQADAQVHPFEPASFDVAISRTGTMFFGDPIAAFTNIARAVRPGGRLALVTWQSPERNEWIREFGGALSGGRGSPVPPPDAPGPFSMCDPERVRTVLERGGFTDVTFEALTAPMWFGNDADGATEFVLGQLGWMLADRDEAERVRARAALHASAAEHETAAGVLYESGAWVICATRV